MRLAILAASLVLALVLAIWSSQVPAPRDLSAPPETFSSARAMIDVRQIARAPHPVGSDEHVRVRLYLLERMAQLGLSPSEQSGPLSPQSIRRLERQGGTPEAANNMAINLVGRLPGKDGTKPPVLIMAHYDTVTGSPGAADDTTGVAAGLEIIRALKARGPTERDVILLFTDAEELGLDGARLFFSEHSLRDRVGAIINLEARGGGGRAAMFETGRDNGQTIAAFAPTVRRADGGTTSTSLAVFMYERMPNGSDFTIPKDRGIGGLNFAFIGRPGQYHSPESTPENLDQGSVQHIGSQALEATDALARATTLPGKSPNAVYADIFGLFLITHSPAVGWVLIGLTFLLAGVAFWKERQRLGLSYRSVLLGSVDGLWLVTTGMVFIQTTRLLAGPLADRNLSSADYYVLLHRLPWMEAGAALTILAVLLTLLSGARHKHSRFTALSSLAMTGLALFMGGFNLSILIIGLVATGLSLWPLRRVPSIWGSWLGLILLIGLGGTALQAFAPQAALIFVWPALIAALIAAILALVRPDLDDPRALILPALAAIIIGAWLMGLGHLVFLGVGIAQPGALALFGLLIALFLRPLSPAPGQMRKVMAVAILSLILAGGINLGARWAAPAPPVTENLP
jgi:hypothetical protein